MINQFSVLPSQVRFAHKGASKAQVEGAFTCLVYLDSVLIRTFSRSIAMHGVDVAWEGIMDCAKRASKEHDIPILQRSKEELTKLIGLTSKAKDKNAPWLGWKNQHTMLTFVKKGIADYDILTVESMMREMLVILEDEAKVERERMKLVDEADTLHAKALVDVFNKTGIDVSGSITNSKVLCIYKDLLKETTP